MMATPLQNRRLSEARRPLSRSPAFTRGLNLCVATNRALKSLGSNTAKAALQRPRRNGRVVRLRIGRAEPPRLPV
jgi:hypothetical protein